MTTTANAGLNSGTYHPSHPIRRRYLVEKKNGKTWEVAGHYESADALIATAAHAYAKAAATFGTGLRVTPTARRNGVQYVTIWYDRADLDGQYRVTFERAK